MTSARQPIVPFERVCDLGSPQECDGLGIEPNQIRRRTDETDFGRRALALCFGHSHENLHTRADQSAADNVCDEISWYYKAFPLRHDETPGYTPRVHHDQKVAFHNHNVTLFGVMQQISFWNIAGIYIHPSRYPWFKNSRFAAAIRPQRGTHTNASAAAKTASVIATTNTPQSIRSICAPLFMRRSSLHRAAETSADADIRSIGRGNE